MADEIGSEFGLSPLSWGWTAILAVYLPALTLTNLAAVAVLAWVAYRVSFGGRRLRKARWSLAISRQVTRILAAELTRRGVDVDSLVAEANLDDKDMDGNVDSDDENAPTPLPSFSRIRRLESSVKSKAWRRRARLIQAGGELGSSILKFISRPFRDVSARVKHSSIVLAARVYGLHDVYVKWSTVERASEFGLEMREKYFALDPDAIFLNNGSYGATPRIVTGVRNQWEVEVEREPVRFRFTDLLVRYKQSAARLATFVGAGVNDLQFIQNVNYGVNLILRGLVLQPGDVILTLDTEYHANQLALEHVCERRGSVVHLVHVEWPASDAAILSSIEAALVEIGGHCRLALFDHISSASAFIFPIKDMIHLCHRHSVPVLVDGAHAPGQIDLDIRDLDADYYVGTCHKWLFSCKGVAFIVVRQELQRGISPLVVPYEYKRDFEGNSFAAMYYSGLQDFSPYFAVRTSIEFIDECCFGLDALMAHNHNLVLDAARMLAALWETDYMHEDHQIGAMALVRIPLAFNVTKKKAHALTAYLCARFGITVPIFCHKVAGVKSLYARISAQVFNTMADYEALGKAVMELRRSGSSVFSIAWVSSRAIDAGVHISAVQELIQ